MTNLNIPCINNDLALLCEGSVLVKECYDAIMPMSCDKTTDSDGLPVNVYKIFWEDIKTLLCEVFNIRYKNEEPSPSMNRGIITLLPPKNKDIRHLKNWHPISLLSTLRL